MRKLGASGGSAFLMATVVLFAARCSPLAASEEAGPKNLALSARGARAQSWEAGVPVLRGKEPSRANYGSLKSYWAVQ